jgi:BolA protein
VAIDRTATLDLIRSRLASLAPTAIDIVDDSHRHAGHAGAREGGHFTLTVCAPGFAGKTKLQSHRMVLDLLGDLHSAGIHALSIVTRESPAADQQS